MSITESLVNDILAHPFDREWSIQGFGMLRTYLDDEHIARLHIWDTGTAVEDVSTIHDHPWDFTSRVVRGELRNQRFALLPHGAPGWGLSPPASAAAKVEAWSASPATPP